jgi:hypothetical protein
VPSLHPESSSELTGISVISPHQAWAAGDYFDNQTKPFAAAWDGAAWRHVPAPDLRPPPFGNTLIAVAAVSGHDAWAPERTCWR